MATKLSTKALNFTPTQEEAALIERAAAFDTVAQIVLATKHNILFRHYPQGTRGYARYVDASAETPILAAPDID